MAKMQRSTPLKKELLSLFEEHHLLSATQILEKLHKAGIKANKTSVYRNLETFMSDGVICQQAFDHEFVYELQREHHDHVHCNVCGKVQEIPCQVIQLPQVEGYDVAHHHLTLYGTCHSCQKEQ
jgi:Fur family ferric uptake transcriptional regulator